LTMVNFLNESTDEKEYCMIGYYVQNTLSEHGSVSRGVCATDKEGYLTSIVERTTIKLEGEEIYYYEGGEKILIAKNTPVSMNFWGFKQCVFQQLKEGFSQFMKEHGSEMKSEYFIPLVINENIVSSNAKTKVIACDSPWFGVTYKEDKPMVEERIKALISSGVYPQSLW
jgi:hypothetical protein